MYFILFEKKKKKKKKKSGRKVRSIRFNELHKQKNIDICLFFKKKDNY